MKKRKFGVFFIILFVMFIITGCCNEKTIYQDAYAEGYNVAYDESVKEINNLQAQIDQLINSTVHDDYFYFAEAYIMSQDLMEEGTYCVCWSVNYSEVQVFLTYTAEPLKEDAPYLLTMLNMGTEDTLDDEVAVIWTTVE